MMLTTFRFFRWSYGNGKNRPFRRGLEAGSSDGITASTSGTGTDKDGGVPFWVWILVALGVAGLGGIIFVL